MLIKFNVQNHLYLKAKCDNAYLTMQVLELNYILIVYVQSSKILPSILQNNFYNVLTKSRYNGLKMTNLAESRPETGST